MSENERDFRKAVSRLKIDDTPNPAHRERLRRQMLQAFEEAGRPDGPKVHRLPQPAARRRTFPFLKLAVAAAVVIGAAVTVYQVSRPADAVAAEIAQVRQAVRGMPWMHVRSVEGSQVEQRWYDMAADKLYLATAEGWIWCWDSGAEQKQFVYNPKVKTLTVGDLPRKGFYDSGSVFAMLDTITTSRQDEGASLERHVDTLDGRRVRVYRFETVRPDDGTSIQRGGVQRVAARTAETFTVDLDTTLILAAHTEYLDSGGQVISRRVHEIDYPQNGPASIYDLGVPLSARVVEMRRNYISTPSTPAPAPRGTGSAGLAPLQIELPRPMFTGTPQNGRVPNLEKPRSGPRPPFLAPLGTANVAFGKPVSSSDREPLVGTLDQITDGDKETGDGNFVELGPFRQHVTIDLLERCEIYAVVVWHHHRWPRVYFDVAVQVSDDRTFRKGVRTVFNNDTDNSLGLGAGTNMNYTETNEGKLIDAKSVQGRYVRLHSNGNTNDELNHYIEVEVYGRPLD